MSFFESKKILISGGAGAIGSNLCISLLEKKAEVIVIDNLSSGSRKNIPKEAVFVEGSINNDKALQKAFSYSPQIIFHLAANFANQSSVDNPLIDLETNGKGTIKLLQHSIKNNVENFIYSSSSCVYGNKSGALNEEDVSTVLDTPYAFTKFLGEQYVNFFHRHFGLDTVILRYFNSYGPREFPGKYRNVIPNFLSMALQGKPLAITGTGNETRDFTFVGDIVNGTLLAAQKKAAIGETFNLGSGKETKIEVLAKKINRLTGNRAGIRYIPKRKWDYVRHRLADIAKSMNILGHSPQTSLDDGLNITIEWFKGR
ncbi:NAD-dependent epimerase/dehydratase family protein [Candidatus Woesearchaeota archaeon]|nr:NAD-dependent epimerase/dehydratase family protein [Candidatus Woesearchaeota archaeon]